MVGFHSPKRLNFKRDKGLVNSERTACEKCGIGGFWVGPSVEGLLALGTVRFLPEAMASKQAVINSVKYNLPMFRSPTDRHMRTFYPEFFGIE